MSPDSRCGKRPFLVLSPQVSLLPESFWIFQFDHCPAVGLCVFFFFFFGFFFFVFSCLHLFFYFFWVFVVCCFFFLYFLFGLGLSCALCLLFFFFLGFFLFFVCFFFFFFWGLVCFFFFFLFSPLSGLAPKMSSWVGAFDPVSRLCRARSSTRELSHPFMTKEARHPPPSRLWKTSPPYPS